jgi:hypothetical protein
MVPVSTNEKRREAPAMPHRYLTTLTTPSTEAA